MRQKRAKAYRKLMSLYCMSFGFREPYQVLIDSEMCKTAIVQKMDFQKQLGTVLQGEVKPMITQCCIHELYLQGKAQQLAVDLAKTFERRKCNHREPIPGDDCLMSVVVINETNKHRYVVATQSAPLRSNLRKTPAVPIVHVNRSVMILEPPSEATLKAKEAMESEALGPSTAEKAHLAKDKPEEAPKKKKKGPKNPNPLSVKKKKPKGQSVPPKKPEEAMRAGQKRKRGDTEAQDTSRAAPSGESGRGHKRKRRRKAKDIPAEVSKEDS